MKKEVGNEHYPIDFTSFFNMVCNGETMKERKRRSEWGKGWDGRSRIPDKTFKENFDQIDWSYVKKEENKKDDTTK